MQVTHDLAEPDALQEEMHNEEVYTEYDHVSASEELREVVAENEMLASVCEKQKSDLDSLRKHVQQLQDELAASASSVPETESHLDEQFAKDLATKTAEIERLRDLLSAEKSKQKSQIDAAQEEQARLTAMLSKAHLSHKAQVEPLQAQVAELKREVQEQKQSSLATAAAPVIVAEPQQRSEDHEAVLRNLRIQVESLSVQLQAERESTGEERQAEIAELTKLREANDLMEQKVAQLVESESSARKKSEMLRAHLLEREEELEALATHIGANKEFIEGLQAELQVAEEASGRVHELEMLLEDKAKHIERTEKALANLDEAVGLMTEDHRVELTRKERLLREKFTDELEAKLKNRSEESEGVLSALRAQVEARELEINRLVVTLTEKDKKEDALMKEVGPLREALNEAVRKLTDAIDKDQYSVDKRLVSNLVFSYFCNNGGKKTEILCLLLRILDVPKANREKIYAASSGGWFGTRFSEEDEEERTPSIGDMWVEFLLKEAQAVEDDERVKEERVKLEKKTAGSTVGAASGNDNS